MERRVLLVLALLIFLSGTGIADEYDFDLLFGGDIFQELEESPQGGQAVETVLVGDRLEAGGSYRLGLDMSRLEGELDEAIRVEISRDELRVTLEGDVYVDLRPNPTWRAFMKWKYAGRISHVGFVSPPPVSMALLPFGEGSSESLEISLHELFLDYTFRDKLYLRAGKQTVNWGVGYFFSPADVINISRIDPANPEELREGPVALKAQYPVGSSNYCLYLIFEDMKGIKDIAVAPKVETVVGGTEIGLGGFYRADRPARLMATLSSTVGKVGVFAESVLTFGQNPAPGDERLSWEGTVGGRYSYRDDEGLFDITTAAQYLYSKGHQGAFLVSWNNLLKSKFTLSAFWQGYFSRKSGILDISLGLPSIEFIQPQLGVRRFYSENDPSLRATQAYFAVTLGSGSF